MGIRQSAPSTARNREPILNVLQRILPQPGRVLELASGSGEHAIYFAKNMPSVTWRPSDPDPAARNSIAAWVDAESLSNVLAPKAIDVRDDVWGVEAEAPFDAIVAINMIHISPWEATLGLMAGAGRLLHPEGVLLTYGPYMRDRRHTAPSNEIFDAWLKTLDERFGVRDVADVEQAAVQQGLRLQEIVEMPANNMSLVFRRH
jgi:cyclopropane fatty-acyl-phospholipid synthase-like methyltransferase